MNSFQVYDPIVRCHIEIKYDGLYISIPKMRWNKPENITNDREAFDFVNFKVGKLVFCE